MIQNRLALPRLPENFRVLLGGFLYWLAFLLVLEPDNLARALHAGYQLSLHHEALRIAGAASIGAVATPWVMAMSRRFPLNSAGAWRNLALHALGTACMAGTLIVTSCFLAAWGFQRQWLPTLPDVRDELVSNLTLLMFALAFFTTILHLLRFFPTRDAVSPDAAAHPSLTRIPVKSRGRLSFVDINDVDWIETQGNYVALHAGSRTHLLRDTLTNFEPRLAGLGFVRIHRRMLVATRRIRDMRAENNGDATLRLSSGVELRVSRRHRKALREAWVKSTHSG